MLQYASCKNWKVLSKPQLLFRNLSKTIINQAFGRAPLAVSTVYDLGRVSAGPESSAGVQVDNTVANQLNGQSADSGCSLALPQATLCPPHRLSASRDICRNTLISGSTGQHTEDTKKALFCIEGDINALAPFEQTGNHNERDSSPLWISAEDLKNVLKKALPTALRSSDEIRFVDPVTTQQLDLRLHQAMAYPTPPSLSRLIKYHGRFQSLQSASTYNTLIQIAIRHTTYTAAFRLFSSMEERKIRPNVDTKLLYVRSLVRTGRLAQAWTYIRREMPALENGQALRLVVELLGRRKKEEFCRDEESDRTGPKTMILSGATPLQRAENVGTRRSVRDYHPLILPTLASLLSSNAQPSHYFLCMIVSYLLQISQVKIARAITLKWLSNLPERLTALRRRQSLHLLHLHLRYASRGLKSHFDCRRFVRSCLRQKSGLRPTSSTLFLQLRSLKHARGQVTFHAIQLATAMRKKWGPSIIDTYVRRRIVSIALREGHVNAARKWLAEGMRADVSRKKFVLQRAIVGEPHVKPSTAAQRLLLRRSMAAIHREGRLWRFTKRRLWRKMTQKKDTQSRLNRQPKRTRWHDIVE